MPNPFTDPAGLPLILPSILSADFAAMAEDCASVVGDGLGDALHLDVMDGHFVPNLTMGPDMCRALSKRLPGVFLDVHLMVTDPAAIAERFVETGAGHVTFHVETVKPDEAAALAEAIRAGGASVGIAINPPTPVETLEPVLELADLLLVMSVNPGFGGQAFIDDVLTKPPWIRERLGDEVRVEFDGGVDANTAPRVLESGGDVLVAGSAIFGRSLEERSGVIRALRG